MKRHLSCCVCGAHVGRFEQHWNRDTGYGICASCVTWLLTDNTKTRQPRCTPAEIKDLYGKEGINYPAFAP